MSVYVETRFADGLMDDLPGAGLTGRRVSESVVEVTSWDRNESDEDVAFYLGGYADRLGIVKLWSEAEQPAYCPGCGDPPSKHHNGTYCAPIPDDHEPSEHGECCSPPAGTSACLDCPTNHTNGSQ